MFTLEVRLLKTILRLTQAQRMSDIKAIVEELRLPRGIVRKGLKRLHEDGLFGLEGDVVRLNPEQRVKTLVKTVELGADIETATRLLDWKEFEHLIGVALDAYAYKVIPGFRFKHGRKRWEVDVLALKKPWILCVDCKHLRRRQTSTVRKAVDINLARAEDLSKALPTLRARLDLHGWKRAQIVPIIITLLPTPSKVFKASPIVPVIQLKDFISRFTPRMFTSLDSVVE